MAKMFWATRVEPSEASDSTHRPSGHVACSRALPSPPSDGKDLSMTFGKCVWDGCTRHAEKAATSACRSHHVVIRASRCEKCQGPLTSRLDLEQRRCRRCASMRAA